MKHFSTILLLLIFSLCGFAQQQPETELSKTLELTKDAWRYTSDIASIFKFYSDDMDELKSICFDSRDELDSIYFITKRAQYKSVDISYIAEDLQLPNLQKQIAKIQDYLKNAEEAITYSTSSMDLLFGETTPDNIFMLLYQSEEYFNNARQQLKKAEKELEKVLKSGYKKE